MDTLGSMQKEVTRWLKGDLLDVNGQLQILDAINDGIESIWMEMMQAQLSRFLGSDSPVTFTLASGAERVKLVSIPDPTVALVLGTVGGGALAGRTYNASYTYVTESGTETKPSAVQQQVVGANNLLTIVAPAAVPNALGWNLYVGVVNQALQNQGPYAFGVTITEPLNYTITEELGNDWASTTYNGFQDYPTFSQVPPLANDTADNISWIQHLEFVTTDGVKQTWNRYQIDDQVMRRMARTFPSASQYSTYVWDLINGDTLEFRPVAGVTFAPRYWYVAKPRRLRYPQAEINYVSITGFHEALRNKALALCKLSLDEYIAADHYTQLAAQNVLQIKLALNAEDWNQHGRIVPYLF